MLIKDRDQFLKILKAEGFVGALEDLPPEKYRQFREGRSIRTSIDGQLTCPIIAVYHKRTGMLLPNVKWQDAANVLGLSFDEAVAIASSADGSTNGTGYSSLLRKQIESSFIWN